MAHLIDLKLTKEEAKKQFGSPETVLADRPKFPFGLTIHLGEETLKKLNMKEMPKVGAELAIEAYVTVSSVSATETVEGGADRDVHLQITDLAFTPRTEAKSSNAAEKLFGKK